MKITIACPTNRGINPKTMQCLLELVARGGYDLHIICPENGYTIAENRNYTAVQALNAKSDYLLMVDDDMTFEPDILDRLLANDKDICGVAYHSRGSDNRMKCVENEIMSIVETDKRNYINLETNTDPKYKTLFECYATGTGIILIKCSVFLKITRPWFEFKFFPTGQCEEGEDWMFCLKAKEFGYKIYADPRPKVGHLGEIIY